MILHNDSSYQIYFGDKKDRCVKSDYQLTKRYLSQLKEQLKLQSLFFLNQIHSNQGLIISDPDQLKKNNLFKINGDYLITNLRNIGIGVLTADCLPVILYDPVKFVVAIIHAGWRGSVADIIDKVIDNMKDVFNIEAENLIIHFGACADACCYQVDQGFEKNLEHYSFGADLLIKKHGLFFNLVELNKRLLLNRGVLLQNIRMEYNVCTICSQNFHSYRRDNKTDYRQATIVALK
ncbi:MAG: polyphenol oxidase family protein [bacterium]